MCLPGGEEAPNSLAVSSQGALQAALGFGIYRVSFRPQKFKLRRGSAAVSAEKLLKLHGLGTEWAKARPVVDGSANCPNEDDEPPDSRPTKKKVDDDNRRASIARNATGTRDDHRREVQRRGDEDQNAFQHALN